MTDNSSRSADLVDECMLTGVAWCHCCLDSKDFVWCGSWHDASGGDEINVGDEVCAGIDYFTTMCPCGVLEGRWMLKIGILLLDVLMLSLVTIDMYPDMRRLCWICWKRRGRCLEAMYLLESLQIWLQSVVSISRQMLVIVMWWYVSVYATMMIGCCGQVYVNWSILSCDPSYRCW